MSNKFEAAKQIFKGGKYVFETLVPKIAKNLTTKRNIQDKVVEAVDKGVKAANVPPSLRVTQSASKMKKEKSRELKNYSYTADKITENKAKGGRVGLKRGTFPDLNKDGKTTFADVLIGRGVLPKGKKKKMMAKKSETPMDKSVKKKNKKRII